MVVIAVQRNRGRFGICFDNGSPVVGLRMVDRKRWSIDRVQFRQLLLRNLWRMERIQIQIRQLLMRGLPGVLALSPNQGVSRQHARLDQVPQDILSDRTLRLLLVGIIPLHDLNLYLLNRPKQIQPVLAGEAAVEAAVETG